MISGELARRTSLVIAGGITIGLELVTSRILTPYFGSSLYVWTAILSVTLAALALGYYLGGRRADDPGFSVLTFAYALLGGAASLIVARVLAEFIPLLARGNLVIGAFVGSLLILGPTLTVLSALNPFLIAIERQTWRGDSGGGNIFALSTAGSILGALFTSFALIPNLAGLDILLFFSGISMVLAFASAMTAPGSTRGFMIVLSAVAMALGASCLIDSRHSIGGDGAKVSLLQSYRSVFAQVSVIEFEEPGQRPKLGYFQNGGVQSAVYEDDKTPAVRYIYLMDRVMTARHSKLGRVLVLGLAGGSTPKLLYDRGIAVDVVDINPDAPRIAHDHFGFDPSKANIQISDVRVALRSCSGKHMYDAIVFDVFSGTDPVIHAGTVEAFHDAAGCLRENGLIAVNAVVLRTDSPLLRSLAADMNDATGLPVWTYGSADAQGNLRSNAILAAGGDDAGSAAVISMSEFPSDPVLAPYGDVHPSYSVFEASDRLSDALDRGTLLFAQDQIRLRERNYFPFPVGW